MELTTFVLLSLSKFPMTLNDVSNKISILGRSSRGAGNVLLPEVHMYVYFHAVFWGEMAKE